MKSGGGKDSAYYVSISPSFDFTKEEIFEGGRGGGVGEVQDHGRRNNARLRRGREMMTIDIGGRKGGREEEGRKGIFFVVFFFFFLSFFARPRSFP